MLSIILFIIVLGLLVTFIGLTFLERVYAHTWYENLRRHGDKGVAVVNTYITNGIKNVEHSLSLQNMQIVLLQKGTLFVVRLAQHIESKAQDVTRKMNRTHNITSKTRSDFLQEVATHKQGLDTERIKRETSLASRVQSESK